MARALLLAASALAVLLSQLSAADELPANPAITSEQVQQSVDKAIGYLQTESAAWLNTRKCAACHHVPLPMWALSEAQQHGYSIDAKYLTETMENALGSQEKMIAARLISGPNDPPDTRPLAQGVKTGTVFMAAAAGALPSLSDGQKESLKIIADDIVSKQREDGSWEFFLSRPPVNENETTDGVWIVLALEAAAGEGENDPYRAALAKAKTWLSTTNLPDNLQDKVFKLLLAARAGQSRAAMQGMIDELFSLQRDDGGWAQKPDMPSDAHATGETLYAMALAGLTAEEPPIKRAIERLVTTQQADGSWPMTSRSSPDGKPGGSSKLLTPITCAASSWATLALVNLVPRASPPPVAGP